jgi:rubredoxin
MTFYYCEICGEEMVGAIKRQLDDGACFDADGFLCPDCAAEQNEYSALERETV